MSDLLLLQHEGRVLTATLNRPAKRNALTATMLERLREEMHRVISNGSVRVVILTGQGSSFCAGLDVDDVLAAEAEPPRPNRMIQSYCDLLDAVRSCPKPVIAAVNGHAVAGGAGLMSACDLVVASEFAQIGYPEIRRGLVAAAVMPDLLRQVGARRAKYLLLVGDLLAARQAQEWGLVDEVVAPADLPLRARHLAETLSEYPEQALSLTKNWLHQTEHLAPDELHGHLRKLHVHHEPQR